MPPRWTYAVASFLGAIAAMTLLVGFIRTAYWLTGDKDAAIALTLCLVSASIFGALGYQKGRAVERDRDKAA